MGFDEDDFQAEIRSHLEMAAKEKVADGADPRAARQASIKDFGNVTLTTEAAKRVWTPRWLESARHLVSDIRYAVRSLARQPLFALTVVGVLTLGIALNATVFTMLKSMALSPLAGVDRAAELVVIYRTSPGERQARVSYADFQDLRRSDGAFDELMGSSLFVAGLGRGPRSRSMWTELVSGNYFDVLRVHSQLGRTLQSSDEGAPGTGTIAVISDSFWRTEFNADPNVVGKTIDLNHVPLTIVGVADPSFHGTIVGYEIEAFIPITVAPRLGVRLGSSATTAAGIFADKNASVLYPHGRLRAGTSLASAIAQTDALWNASLASRPAIDASQHLKVVRFYQSPTGGQTYMLPSLMVLGAMGLLVLLIACANIAGLVLVRGLSRRSEIAMRLALGATRARVMRLLVVENLVLAIPGALLGVVATAEAIPWFVNYANWLAAPQQLFFNVGVDRLVLGFAVVVATGCALAFGFVPALQASRVDLVSVVNDLSARSAVRGRLRSGLVVAQVAVSLLLIVGAGLVTRSLESARTADLGFDAKQVAAVGIDLRQNGYDNATGRVFLRRLLDDVRGDASVESAAIAAFNPMGLFDVSGQRVTIEGYEPKKGEELAFSYNVVSTDYFKTLRVPVLAGRTFAASDDESAAAVVMVNRTLAERFLGGVSKAVGSRIRVSDEWRHVVGVAADLTYVRLGEPPRPYMYLPFPQVYASTVVLNARGRAPLDALVRQTLAHVSAADPDLPTLWARPLQERIEASLVFLRFTAVMLFVFGAAGMLLAAMGTYGLVSYSVKQSTREIGIRMALGATAMSVVRNFLARGVRLGGIGAAIGLAGALAGGGFLRTLLYGVSTTDPVAFGRAIALVVGAVGVATIIPAWRASRTDPLRALRHQ